MRPDGWIALALFGAAVLYFCLSFDATLDLRDEGYLLVRSAQVADGALPHRDFQDVYGPGVFALTGLALALGGKQVIAVRVLVLLFKALAVAASYGLARHVAPRWVAVAATGLGIVFWGRYAANLNTPYAALFTIPLCLAATALLVRGLERHTARGLALAGFVAGLGVLFKQSLGIALAMGLLLSAVAAPWIEEGRGPRARAAWLALAWLALSFVPVAPLASRVTAADWAVHLLPLRAVLVAVALLGLSRGMPPMRSLLRTGLPVALGLAAPSVGTLLAYAIAGGLDGLVHDMLRLPFTLRRYAQAVQLPPPSLALLAVGVIAFVFGALRLVARRPVGAAVAGAIGLGCLVFGWAAVPPDAPGLRDPATLLARGPFALEALHLPVLLVAGLLTSAGRVREEGAVRTRVPLLVVSAFLCFQVFPRAGHNLWILHGALAPLWALVLGDLYRAATASEAVRWRRALAAALVLATPVWLALPIARATVSSTEAQGERRPLALERARGLRLDAVQRTEQEIPHVEAMIGWLETGAPAGRLLLLTNEPGIAFLAGRATVFGDEAFAHFLAGWGMLAPAGRRALDASEEVSRLRTEAGVLAIHRADPSATHLRRALPRVREIVERDFRVIERFGPYRVLERGSSP